jgi:hypothetical protein
MYVRDHQRSQSLSLGEATTRPTQRHTGFRPVIGRSSSRGRASRTDTLGDDMPRAAYAWCATALLPRLLSGSPSAPKSVVTGGPSRPVQEWLSSGADVPGPSSFVGSCPRVRAAVGRHGRDVSSYGHPRPSGAIALMPLPGEQMPGHAARELDQRRRPGVLSHARGPVPATSARPLAASRCRGPCLHEEVAAPAEPVAAQVRRNYVAATRREEQEASSPRSLVR